MPSASIRLQKYWPVARNILPDGVEVGLPDSGQLCNDPSHVPENVAFVVAELLYKLMTSVVVKADGRFLLYASRAFSNAATAWNSNEPESAIASIMVVLLSPPDGFLPNTSANVVAACRSWGVIAQLAVHIS